MLFCFADTGFAKPVTDSLHSSSYVTVRLYCEQNGSKNSRGCRNTLVTTTNPPHAKTPDAHLLAVDRVKVAPVLVADTYRNTAVPQAHTASVRVAGVDEGHDRGPYAQNLRARQRAKPTGHLSPPHHCRGMQPGHKNTAPRSPQCSTPRCPARLGMLEGPYIPGLRPRTASRPRTRTCRSSRLIDTPGTEAQTHVIPGQPWVSAHGPCIT